VEIVAGVRCAAQARLLRKIPEHEHGRLAGDSLGLSEHVLVGHQVTHDQDAAALEPLDDPEEVGDLRASHGLIGGTARRIDP
jgi:hypothetical protein